MDDLNKQQIILLVLLVSFVTSIATGIITVSLLDKAPVEVQQTINRVVERTVETVVPEDIQPQERVVTVKETVVVTEENRVVEAISQNKSNVARIMDLNGSFLTLGVVSSTEGEIVTVDGVFSQLVDYRVSFDSGEEFDLEFNRRDNQTGATYFKIINADEKQFTKGSFSQESLQLGQSVVAISGSSRNIVSTGLVSDLIAEGQIITNLDISSMSPGTVLLNLSGEVVGLLTRSGVFVSAQTLLALEAIDASNTAAASQAFQ